MRRRTWTWTCSRVPCNWTQRHSKTTTTGPTGGQEGAKTVYHHHTAHGCKSTHELGRDISTGRDATALTSYLLEALHKPWALILGGIRLWHAGAVVALHRHRLALTRLPTSASVRFWNARESRTDVHATALPRELATSRALALEAPAHS
jgi:hypothetical protein